MLSLLLGLACGPALAQQTPVKISADRFEVQEDAQQATFIGNVQVERDGMLITAEKVFVEYGEGGVSDIETFTATGSVQVTTEDQVATSKQAIFVPSTQTLTMSGDVKVVSASGTLTGPQLVIDLKTKTSVFSGGGGDRVTGVFTPQ